MCHRSRVFEKMHVWCKSVTECDGLVGKKKAFVGNAAQGRRQSGNVLFFLERVVKKNGRRKKKGRDTGHNERE